MKIIEKVELVFENCETIEFTEDEIHFVYFEGINTSKYMDNDNNVIEDTRCEHYNMAFKLSANKAYYPFGVQGIGPKMKFDRIQECKDITAVGMTYTDNSEEYIYILWNDEISEYENRNQTVNVDEKYFYVIG